LLPANALGMAFIREKDSPKKPECGLLPYTAGILKSSSTIKAQCRIIMLCRRQQRINQHDPPSHSRPLLTFLSAKARRWREGGLTRNPAQKDVPSTTRLMKRLVQHGSRRHRLATAVVIEKESSKPQRGAAASLTRQDNVMMPRVCYERCGDDMERREGRNL
jgi:hypothetical protein